jgi:cytochrome c biogenesis protein CcdA/thiol-disulfide isomerase/thioredoxin
VLVLFAFAFLAGIFTVLSPCILPILPALLSAGTARGKWRPFGIIIGLIVSFSFFTLALTAIVRTFGISANYLRYAAIVLISLFGIVMLFPRLSDWFAKVTARIAGVGLKMQPLQAKGFWGGIVFGCALGLLWTPCAGPILATITTLVATQAVTTTAILMTLAYSIGAGIPLFLIAYGSSKIIAASRFLSKHAEGIRRFFGGVMIVLAVVLAFQWDMLLEQKLIGYLPQSLVENNPRLEQELKKIRGETTTQGKAPDLVGIVNWINTPPLSLQELKGKVVLIDFWTYSCINCLRTLPYLEKWDRDYRNKGLVIIGVHTPEFEFEKNFDNVSKAAKQLGVNYPIAMDNNYETWNAYHNHYWPAHYLIDQDGNIRMVHFGEGGYIETENGIRALLGLSPLVMQEIPENQLPMTQETYLGLERGRSYTREITLAPHADEDYSYKPPLGEGQVGLRGRWRAEDEFILSEGDNDFIDINYLAKQIYIVLAGESAHSLQVSLDGKIIKEFEVHGSQKYDLANASYQRHLLSLKVPKGIKAYVFTFGNE